jgi:hypothetical protein
MVGEGWRRVVKRFITFVLKIDNCREACRDPDNLNRLASSLIEHLTPVQEDLCFKSPEVQNLAS